MRRLLILFFAVFLPSLGFAQDIIHKTDSSIIQAKVQEINSTEIKYRKFSNPDGPVYTVLKSEVAYVVYQNGEKEIYSAPPPPVVKVAYDTLAYVEKMLGVTLKAVTSPDTGVMIVDVVNTGRVKAPGLNPPKNNILQYIGTTDKKDELKATGIRVTTPEEAMRAIVLLKNQGHNKVYMYTRFSQYVNHVYNADITDLVFTQEQQVEQVKTDSIKQKSAKLNAYRQNNFYITAGFSMRNDYSTLTLNSWFYEINGITAPYDQAISDGPESYYFLNMTYSFPLSRKKAKPVCMGFTFLANYWKDLYGFWSLQGRVVSYASSSPANYIRLRPLKLGLGMPLRFPITSNFAFVFTPTLLYAKLHGLSYGSTDPDMRYYGGKSSGIGMSVDGGLELLFTRTRFIGVTAQIGFRRLKTKLYSSPDDYEYTQVTFQDGSPVYVELDGLYIQLGVTFRMSKKQ